MTVDDYLAKIDIDKILYINKIPLDTFVLKKVPIYNPQTTKYRKFWEQETRRCVEGLWVEHDGLHKWVTPQMYFYANYWHILLNPKNAKSKTKIIAKPLIRDLEWIKLHILAEAKGFSGFSDDDEYTCHRLASKGLNNLDEAERIYVTPEMYRKDGTPKKYISAREYLRMYHDKPKGKALYQNQALNVVDIEARGGGKSYIVSSICGQNFLFDGAVDYDEYMAGYRDKNPLSSETLIGAIDTKYSGDLIKKVKLGLENLEGEFKLGKKIYPAPFSKKYSGSWESGKTIIQEYDVKIGGNWVVKGTRSKFQHRSFKDNPFAGNGTRGSFNVIDEVGFMGNLIAALGQMADCVMDGDDKMGVIWLTGTGGDMDGGATEAVKKVYYEPDVYDCIGFDDAYEGSGKQIGLFIPTWMALNQFKDDLGNTNYRAAILAALKRREKKAKAKDKKAYNDEIAQRPLFPGDAFLITGGNLFNVKDLRDLLGKLESSVDPEDLGVLGRMGLDGSGNPVFNPDLEHKLFACSYPVRKDDDQDGAIVIWEQPDSGSSYGMYLGGIDPYDHDQANSSASLGSLLLFKRATVGVNAVDKLVAEYTARPGRSVEFYEQCRRLLIYYGIVGTCLYENEKMGIKTHFDNKHSTHLLAPTPTVAKANSESKVNRQIGQHMSKPVKSELEIMARDWLLEPCGGGMFNWQFIKSKPLLKELIQYNDTGNFDRVIAFMLCILQLRQMHNIIVEQVKEEKEDPFYGDFFERSLF